MTCPTPRADAIDLTRPDAAAGGAKTGETPTPRGRNVAGIIERRNGDRLLPHALVAERLGYTPGGLRVARCRGAVKLAAHRLGRRAYYSEAEVEAVIESRKR